jgi:hypothetical protein
MMLRPIEPQRALRVLLEAACCGGADSTVRFHLINNRDEFTAARFEACLLEMRPDQDRESRLRRIFAEARDGADTVQEVLVRHLAIAVGLCRRAGAEPVLLTYPEQATFTKAHEQAVRRVAREQVCGWVWLPPTFEQALATQPRRDLFVSDGHCTARGYGLMAKAIAEDARRRLRT